MVGQRGLLRECGDDRHLRRRQVEVKRLLRASQERRLQGLRVRADGAGEQRVSRLLHSAFTSAGGEVRFQGG